MSASLMVPWEGKKKKTKTELETFFSKRKTHLAAAVDKEVAVRRVELGCGDDLSELLHVLRLDVDNVYRAQDCSLKKKRERAKADRRTKALVRDVHVPQVDTEVVGRDESLAVRVDRDRVDVIGVCVGVDTTRDVGKHFFLARELGNAQSVGSAAGPAFCWITR